MSDAKQRDELMLAEIMAQEVKRGRKQAILERVKSDVEVVLDLGCGKGAFTELVAMNRPASLVIGLDKSTLLLSMMRKERKKTTWT